MTGAPAASVVIASRDDDDVIGRQLACLAAQTTTDFEVVIADNGGSTRLRAIAASWRPGLDVRVVEATARVGCGPARNVGVAAASADVLLFCDAGDHVAPGWVQAYLDVLDQYDFATGPKASVVASAVTGSLTADAFERAAFSSGPNTAGSRPYASGGNSAYRREVLEAIGGFGTHNLRREDVEASWLALDRGFRLGFAPDAKLLYVAREGARARWLQSFGYGVGLEALRRQLDADGRWMQPMGSFVKLGLARTRRDPSHLVPFTGGLAGRLVERALPGRYFERVRGRARQLDAEALRSLRVDDGDDDVHGGQR